MRDPLRREAFLLSRLQGVQAWRGNLVDYVIERGIVPALKNGWSLNANNILMFAKNLFDRQAAFALAHRLREPNLNGSIDDHSFAAFYKVEYGEGVSAAELGGAWREVELAIRNLLSMLDLLSILGSATHLVTQRTLYYPLDDVGIFAKPDLIAFFQDGPPLIVDWKVHARDTGLPLAANFVCCGFNALRTSQRLSRDAGELSDDGCTTYRSTITYQSTARIQVERSGCRRV